MKITISVVLLLLSFQAIFSQNAKEKKLTCYTHLDTIIEPDYFTIEIAVAENVKYEKEGKKWKTVLVPLDTVMQSFIAELKRLGFKEPLQKKAIAEKKSRWYGDWTVFDNKPLFQAAYQFNITNRDSVKYLFKGISKENLASFLVTPNSYDITLARVKEKLFTKGLDSNKEYVQKIAENNNYKIISQSNDVLGYYAKETKFKTKHNVYSQPRDFVIDLSDIEMEYHTIYTYTLEDK